MYPSERNGRSISLVPHFVRILRNSIRVLLDAWNTSDTMVDNSKGWRRRRSVLVFEKMHLYDCKYISKEVRKTGETDARTPMSQRSMLDILSVVHGSDWRNRCVSKQENPAPCRIMRESIVLFDSLPNISGLGSEYVDQKKLPSWKQNAFKAELSLALELLARLMRICACEDVTLMILISMGISFVNILNDNASCIVGHLANLLAGWPPEGAR